MKRPEVTEVSQERLMALLAKARTQPLEEADFQQLMSAVETLGLLTGLLADKATTLRRLRQLFGIEFTSTEKTADVLANLASDGPPESNTGNQPGEEPKKAKRDGHGRTPAQAYEKAERVKMAHTELKHGGPCPECNTGTVYTQKEPAQLVRVTGQAPLHAVVYELERLRCGSCGLVFTAEAPESVGPDKYDETAAAMMAEARYGTGVPTYRLARLQERLGVPMPASTQWGVLEESADLVKAARDELIRQAAQGEVVHNDDTTMRILKLARPEGDTRTGVFTSGVVSMVGVHRVAVFLTGRQHAGENLSDVLQQRAAGLPVPVLMCDASASNTSELDENIDYLLARCIPHGRRKLVAVAGSFPGQCRHVLVELGKVFKVDAAVKEKGLSGAGRLASHQRESKPIMDGLEKWMKDQMDQKLVEPNSGLGKAIGYFQRHWKGMTLFLRQENAPLDNNIAERALKKAVLHRKNSLFYRTVHGAEVGDLYMSLIHTCELNGVNSFDYLVELQRHAEELAAEPGAWMPWNYRETMAKMAAAA